MAFGKKVQGEAIVYEYGCLPPTQGEEAMVAQLRGKNALWNEFVQIERAYREKVRAVLDAPEVKSWHEQRLEEIQGRLDELRKAIRARRKRARGVVDVDDLVQEINALKKEKAELAQASREARRARVQAARSALEALEQERVAAVKEAEKRYGLYWGNYDDVRHSYEVARQRAAREGKQLKFHRWDGTGKVTVRYQYGLPVPQVFGADTRLQIDPVPAEAWQQPRAIRKRLTRTKVRLRVGTNADRSPVWVELPMVMHRPLPPDGVIRSASVVREKVGPRYRYKLVLTVVTPSLAPPKEGPVVGIDIGWRLMPQGLRVAFWRGEDGAGGELVLGEETTSQFVKLRDLQAIRDRHFNEAKELLMAFVRTAEAIPDWFALETDGVEKWRSPSRLVSLLNRWREHRFDGDGAIYDRLQEWAKKDHHLWDWQANLRDQILRRRREYYRVFAARIAERYGVVCLEDFDLSDVARQLDPEVGPRDSSEARFWRVVAACSELRQQIINACRRRGVRVIMAPSEYTTQTCHVCGWKEKFDAAANLWHRCSKCGALWDQDLNAAANLLQWGMSQRTAVCAGG